MMKLRVAVPVLALALAGGWLMGEDKKADPKEPTVVVSKGLPPYFKKLGLTDEQTREIRKVRGTYTAKIDVLKAQISALQAEEKVEIEKLLTDAQKARLKELRSGEAEPSKDKPPAKDAPAKDAPLKDKPTIK
jgi:hypothetical protein